MAKENYKTFFEEGMTEIEETENILVPEVIARDVLQDTTPFQSITELSEQKQGIIARMRTALLEYIVLANCNVDVAAVTVYLKQRKDVLIDEMFSLRMEYDMQQGLEEAIRDEKVS